MYFWREKVRVYESRGFMNQEFTSAYMVNPGTCWLVGAGLCQVLANLNGFVARHFMFCPIHVVCRTAVVCFKKKPRCGSCDTANHGPLPPVFKVSRVQISPGVKQSVDPSFL